MNKLFFSNLGKTESLLSIDISDDYKSDLQSDSILNNYKISNFFKGKYFFKRLIKKIFKYKLKNDFIWMKDFWNNINIVSVDASLSISNKKYDDFELDLMHSYNRKKIKNIYKYKKLIEDGNDLGCPIYITGSCLNLLGAKAENNELFMLDGSRRLISSVLAKKKSIKILILKLNHF